MTTGKSMSDWTGHRMILHVDMDAFFAAIEMRDDPTLKGKPVIIGAMPGMRGVVSTCSYEARKFGVHSAMPISEAYRRCPNGVYLRPDMKRYSTASKKVMRALQDVSPIVEPVSVDEAYMDISGLERLWGGPEKIGRRVKEAIWEATKLSASVGIGPNRLVAKIASDFNKPDGLTIIAPTKVLEFLLPLEISRLRGVGKVFQRKMRDQGILTIRDLHRYTEEQLVQRFGLAAGRMLYRQARGIASDIVGQSSGRKSISKETTFNEDVTDLALLRKTLRMQSEQVGSSCRRKQLKGRCITLKIRLTGFETHTCSLTLADCTDQDKNIFSVAWKLYENSDYKGKAVRLIGVGISDWSTQQQLDLFASKAQQESTVTNIKDEIRMRFGSHVVGFRAKKEKPRSK